MDGGRLWTSSCLKIRHTKDKDIPQCLNFLGTKRKRMDGFIEKVDDELFRVTMNL